MSFSLMFACEPKPQHPLVFPGLASFKLDGIRSATKGQRTWTRSSKEVPNLFTRARLNICEGIDGEFIIGSPNHSEVFDLSSSAFRTHWSEPDFRLYAFDNILDSSLKVEDRLAKLPGMISEYNHTIRHRLGDAVDRIILLPQRLVRNMEELEAFYAEALELGYEGLIYKRLGKAYKHGRSTSISQEQIKMKPLEDSEAVVLEFLEGMTNLNEPFINERGLQERSSHQENKVPNGMVGKIRCRDIYTGVEFLCSPGKMSHDVRKDAWRRREEFVGALFTYTFFPVGNYDKPRMNRFKAFRPRVDIDLSKAKYL